MRNNLKLGERRRLAREARRALCFYIYFIGLTPGGYTADQLTARRKLCLDDARQALDELAELHEEVESWSGS